MQFKFFRFLWLGLLLFHWAAALTLTITPATAVRNIEASLDTGFFGAPEGNIDLTISGKAAGSIAELYTHTTALLTDPNGYSIPDEQLRWKVYWASTDSNPWTGVDNTSSAGFSDWVNYHVLTDDRVLVVNPAVVTDVSITMGTLLNRVPAVQPAGRYTTQILYTVTQ